jgi:hypothetical protein
VSVHPTAIVDLHCRAIRDFAAEQLFGQRILQVALDRALERPRAVDRIVADPAEPALGGIAELERDLAVLEQALHPPDLDLDDRRHVLGREPVKQDDLIEAVEELGAEMPADHLHHLRLDRIDILPFLK